MVKTAKAEQPPKLNNLTLAWKEGWLAFVTAPKRTAA